VSRLATGSSVGVLSDSTSTGISLGICIGWQSVRFWTRMTEKSEQNFGRNEMPMTIKKTPFGRFFNVFFCEDFLQSPRPPVLSSPLCPAAVSHLKQGVRCVIRTKYARLFTVAFSRINFSSCSTSSLFSGTKRPSTVSWNIFCPVPAAKSANRHMKRPFALSFFRFSLRARAKVLFHQVRK
jgi:hypothetical protein